MQNNDKDKMIRGNERGVQQKKVPETREYFFAGGGEYVPQTVHAASVEEAEQQWEKTRQKVGE